MLSDLCTKNPHAYNGENVYKHVDNVDNYF